MAFDPYHKWLGIPPKDQPPNHYRLLGIELFEADPDVIDAAANRQMAYLQSCAAGPNSDLSQKLLNEIAAARVCLLDLKKKALYDSEWKNKGRQTQGNQTKEPTSPNLSSSEIIGERNIQKVGPKQQEEPFSFPNAENHRDRSLPFFNASENPHLLLKVLLGLAAGIGLIVLAVGVFFLANHLFRPTPNDTKDGAVAADGLVEMSSNKPAVSPSKEKPPASSSTKTSLPQPPKKNEEPIAPAQKTISNSIGMRLVLVPAGKFYMGSPEDETGRWNDEGPRHLVTISSAFYMGVYEVTQAEYMQVMGNNPSDFSHVIGLDTSRFPVDSVTWENAQKFCRRLSTFVAEETAGRGYRLPTEAEWEYACRGGTNTPYHFGPSLSQANFANNRTCPVGSYPPNAFGLYDMHGNVWEWCQDPYSPYLAHPQVDPRGSGGNLYPCRGGSWLKLSAAECRSAKRMVGDVYDRHADKGFRVVCLISDLKKETFDPQE